MPIIVNDDMAGAPARKNDKAFDRPTPNTHDDGMDASAKSSQARDKRWGSGKAGDGAQRWTSGGANGETRRWSTSGRLRNGEDR